MFQPQQPLPPRGSLRVKVIRGVLHRTTELFGEMDPFVMLVYGKKKYKTKTCQNGGKTPSWNQNLQIPEITLEDEVKISCFDKDIIYDDCIGFRAMKFSEFVRSVDKPEE